MKIKSVTLKGFRGYRSSTSIQVGDLCAIVGKNDIGKSTFLEALDIFFNEGYSGPHIQDSSLSCTPS
jgi:predicted ATP-dependent endonuclease of OLD family